MQPGLGGPGKVPPRLGLSPTQFTVLDPQAPKTKAKLLTYLGPGVVHRASWALCGTLGSDGAQGVSGSLEDPLGAPLGRQAWLAAHTLTLPFAGWTQWRLAS